METGEAVEVFDAEGRSAQATISAVDARSVVVIVEHVSEATERRFRWTIAAAVPKGNRADWMMEKLSELGTDRFVPLATQRSVVLPEGKGKRDRWTRIANEAAKQSRRIGVMRIDELVELDGFLRESSGPGWFFSTDEDAVVATNARVDAGNLNLLIGPEGGWTPEETDRLRAAGLTPVSLGATILRVETAAATAAVVAPRFAQPRHSPDSRNPHA
jgi:16S rRNA (uracil1498-N3)-methyltransferase